MAKQSLLARLGDPPSDDSLAAIAWMQRALAAMAGEVLSQPGLTRAQRRAEMLKIADRMGRLRDPDRMYQAEQTLRSARARADDTQPGPQLTDAPDINNSPRPIAARRGRPPSGALR